MLFEIVIFNIDAPEFVIDVGLRFAVNPFDAFEESETVPVNPLRELTVMVMEPDDPLLMVNDEGEAESEKSGVAWGLKLVVIGLPSPVARS